MGKEIMEKLDKEYDKDEVFNKEINQLEKVQPATRALSDMGSFYKKIMDKLLTKDSICYICKKELAPDEKVDIVQVPNHKTDKGLIAFVSICKNCNK